MKTNGATWKAYLASWPKGQWFDDSDEMYDGCESDSLDCSDTAVVTFTCGVVYATEQDREGVSLVRHFGAWLKAQTHDTVICQVPKDKLDEFRAYLKTIGAKTL